MLRRFDDPAPPTTNFEPILVAEIHQAQMRDPLCAKSSQKRNEGGVVEIDYDVIVVRNGNNGIQIIVPH